MDKILEHKILEIFEDFGLKLVHTVVLMST